MTTPRDGARRYRELAVATASRGQGVVLLHEAMLEDLARAAAAIDAGDAAARTAAIARVQAILVELAVSLDHGVAAALSATLEDLYHFAIAELVRADAEASKARLRDVDGILRTLLDGWRAAVAPR